MADAFVVFDDGNARFFRDSADEPFPTTRDAKVYQLVELEQFVDGRAVGRGHDGDAVRRQAGDIHRVGDGEIAMDGFRTTAEDHRIARFETEAAGVRSDIRARFINNQDDANRHAHFLDAHSVRAGPLADGFANGVGQGGDFAHAFGHFADSLIRERQAVEHGDGEAGFHPRFEIFRIGRLNAVGGLLNPVGHRTEQRVLRFRIEFGQRA